MNAHTAKTQFKFELPSLSYIDAKWEEPSLRAPADPAHPARQTGFVAWLARRAAAFRAWQRDRRAVSELGMMTDHELLDIGISRSDLVRVFDPAFNQDLRQRGQGR